MLGSGQLTALAVITLAATIPRAVSAQVNRRAESASEFTRVLSALELSPNLAVVIDFRERKASIVDFRTGAIRSFARSGAGPRELGLPWRLVDLGGDSAAIVDAQHGRALVVRPNGDPGELIRIPGGVSDAVRTARVLPTGALLFERRSAPESVFVVRSTNSGRDQVVSALQAAPGRVVRTRRRGELGEVVRRADVNTGGLDPYPYPGELWEAAPDGWIAVASRSPYRVSWVAPSGIRRVGPEYPIEAQAVSNATKDSLAVDHVREVPAFVAPRPGRYRWPATLPAFYVGRTPTLLFDPLGRVWIRRIHLGEEPPLFDVFDRTGRRVRQVRLDSNERLVGFGRRSLLVAVRDADELEAIRRVPFTF